MAALSGARAPLRVDIRAGYGRQTILEDAKFELAAGERLGVVGTSGAGKSTLVLALMGLLPWRQGWATGTIELQGRELLGLKERELRAVRGSRVALVPQSPMSALNSALTLRTHFEEAWRAHRVHAAPEFGARVRDLLRQVRLPAEESFLRRRPGEISVGQAQRVVLALGLLHRPALLIADEPTSALDPATQVEVLQLLREASERDGMGLLYISHDLLSVLQLCDRLAVMEAGRIVECVAIDGIDEHASHKTTRELLRTLPAPASVLRAYVKRLKGAAE